MNKLLGAFLVVLALALPVFPATTDLGEICWSTNFTDTFSTQATMYTGTKQRFSMDSLIWQGNPSLYQFVATAGAAPSFPTTGNIQAQPMLVGHNTTFFGGNQECTLTITQMNASTLNGTWKIFCTGNPSDPDGFLVTGTMTRVTCLGGTSAFMARAPDVPHVGYSAGEASNEIQKLPDQDGGPALGLQ